MDAPDARPPGGATHEVVNQVDELVGYDRLAADTALGDALAHAGAATFAPALSAQAAELGCAETRELAVRAERHRPELRAFDARGRRVDDIDFDPAWHTLLALARRHGLVGAPLVDRRPGRWAAWAAAFHLHGQVEAGSLCPSTMTQAAIPVLRREPALWASVGERLLAREHDPRDRPIAEKAAAWVGMGMTEKQGGSDVRANATEAVALGAGGRGGEYRLRGHKWFFSAPTSDAHLVTARTADGAIGCFWVPRWRPDGRRNALRLQRLKDKVGNRSNASAEVEFDDAWARMVGDEGRGIPTIIEMATHTRLACVAGSAALMREALVQALHHARGRRAFGRALAAQPLMRAVLADLALEAEAATWVMVRLARAFEAEDDARRCGRGDGTVEPVERAWLRAVLPAAKFWVCKRAVTFCAEAMEVLGGNGYVEGAAGIGGTLARLYREAPVNSIWEGSGNVMALDVLRACAREPDAFAALLDDLGEALGGDALAHAELRALRRTTGMAPQALEASARRLAESLVLLAQAALLRRHAPSFVADAFIASRFGVGWGRVAGAAIDPGASVDALLVRALPV